MEDVVRSGLDMWDGESQGVGAGRLAVGGCMICKEGSQGMWCNTPGVEVVRLL